jgi:hypothetical protein
VRHRFDIAIAELNEHASAWLPLPARTIEGDAGLVNVNHSGRRVQVHGPARALKGAPSDALLCHEEARQGVMFSLDVRFAGNR